MQDYIAKTVMVYDTIAREYADAIEDVAPENERLQFLKLVKKGGRILDVGCAAGRDSFYFANRGLKVIGIDLSEELLKIAKKRESHADFQKQDMRKLKFASAYFDGIWASAALLHLRRDEVKNVLRQFYKILKPRGVLYISLKEGDGEADVRDDYSPEYSRHFTFFRNEELKSLLTQSGFNIEKIYTHSSGRRKTSEGGPLTWIMSYSHKS